MTTPPEFSNNAQARYEGWDIFWSNEYGFQIQRCDESFKFKDDAEAACHVLDMAATYHSAYHLEALNFLLEHGGIPDAE